MITKFSLLKEGGGTSGALGYASVSIDGLQCHESGCYRVTPPEASGQIVDEHINRLIAQLEEVRDQAHRFLKN
jgi:hypothetical protein